MLRFRRWIAFAAVLSLWTSGARADEAVGAKVETALETAEGFGGTSFHLTDPIAALGAPAVPALAAVLADANAPEGRRMLAANALGRMDAPEALVTLRAALARPEPSKAVRGVVEESLFLRGDTAHVDRRIASLATKHRDIPIAAAGARRRLAEAHAATGRFRIAADLMKDLVGSEREAQPERAQADAHNWACYAALAGAKEEALEAVRIAVESGRTDLDWMAKDLDLALLHNDAAFVKTLADARAKRAAKGVRRSDLENDPDYAAFRAMYDAYWKVRDAWIDANNRYWDDYQAWLERGGRTQGKEAGEAYEKEKGPFAAKDPNPEWLPKFAEFFANHRGSALGREARSKLLTLYGNEQRYAAIVDLFLGALTEDPDLGAAGDHADTALWAAEQVSPERLRAVREAVAQAVAARPSDPKVPTLLVALAESHAFRDAAAACAIYTDVAKRFPGTDAAKEAEGALYEMERLDTGAPAPDFTVTDVRGRTWTLSALRGKVVVLDFWATWCGPCLGEVPHVKVFEARGGEGAKDFVLLGISLDEDGWALAEFLENEQIRWSQICDLGGFDAALAKLYHVTGIPRVVLIDRAGRIAAKDLRGEDVGIAVEMMIESAAVPAGTRATDLASPDIMKRRDAARMLGGGAPGAEAAVEALAKALTDADRTVREEAAKALRDLGPKAAPAFAALQSAFTDEDVYVRWRVAEALGKIGPAAKDALTTLDARAKDVDEAEVVRAASERAAERIRAR